MFSFQDIVTSLTGIMVIIILVIVLQLAEAMYEYENPKSDNPEYLELKEKIKELAKRIQEIKEMGEEIPEELKAFVQLSEAEVEEQLQQAQDSKSLMTAEMEKNSAEMETIKLSLSQIRDLLAASEEQKKSAEEIKKVVETKQEELEQDEGIIQLSRKLQSLQQESERLKNEIRINAEKVEFSFQGLMSRHPILIECKGTGFRAQVYKSDEDIQNFMGNSFNSNLSNLISWLKKKDLKKYYPVLLLRVDAFPRIDEIEEALFKLDKNLVIGKEPLDDKVKVF